MIVLGLILLVVGALVAYIAPADVRPFGKITAAIGLGLVVIGVILMLADGSTNI